MMRCFLTNRGAFMAGTGTLINVLCILLGGACGLLFGRALSRRVQEILICGCGLSTVFIGASGAMQHLLVTGANGALETTGSLLLVVSLVLGGLAGETLGIERRIERLGQWLRVKSHSERDPRFLEGFTSASLTVCVGAMAVLGPINDALYQDYTLLTTKGILDAVLVMALAPSLGRGAVFSAIPLALFQGSMTLLARLISPLMTGMALANLSMVGSVLIFCVGINLVFGKKIRVANFLPALILAVAFAYPP